jgi:hypothetical protein
MKVAFLISLFGLFLVACAVSSGWQKDGISPDETVSYLSECEYQVDMNKISDAQKKQTIKSCMQRQGFRWKEN